MRSSSWVLVCGVATMLAASAGAAASDTQVASEVRHCTCAPTDDGLGPCCFPSEGVADSDECGCSSSSRAFALWQDYCQDESCQHAGTCRGPVVHLPRVQPRALLNPIQPSRTTCYARPRRTPVVWLRDLFGWSTPRGASCGSCGGCAPMTMPREPELEVGPIPDVEETPDSATTHEPSSAAPQRSPDPSLPVDGVPHLAPVPEPAPTPKASDAPSAASPTQPTDTATPKLSTAKPAEPSPPMLDAPVPADVIPDQQPEPEKAVEPAAPPAPPTPPAVPNQDLPPVLPENVLPPASPPTATPVSHPHDVRRAVPVPVRKATRLSEYIRVR